MDVQILYAFLTLDTSTVRHGEIILLLMQLILYNMLTIIVIRTRTAQLFFAVTALSCYSEKELSCSGPNRDVLHTKCETERITEEQSFSNQDIQELDCIFNAQDRDFKQILIDLAWLY